MGHEPRAEIRQRLESLSIEQLRDGQSRTFTEIERSVAGEILQDRGTGLTARAVAPTPSSEPAPPTPWLGVGGLLVMATGGYFLVVAPGTEGELVNLQRLTIGAVCTIAGAVFVAAEWRPR